MKKVALIGANGMLATAIKKLAPKEFRLQGFDLPEFDLRQPSQVFALAESAPDLIINCAAFTNVDGCETEQDLAFSVNGEGAGLLANLARQIGATLVHISTDFVFDGENKSPYRETDQTNPLSVYGQSKLLGEQRILQSGLETFYIVRTSWLYGQGGKNFVETVLRLAQEKERLTIVADQRGTPTWTEDLALAIFALLRTGPFGIYHFSNAGECSWFDFACDIVAQAVTTGLPTKVSEVIPIATEAYPLPATRPSYSVLSKEKIVAVTGIRIPDWSESLKTYLSQR